MDFRDILKSFDSLSEATTTTDKGVTTHKGDYGREFDTDDEGNPVVKKVKSTEPKPKGRRPNPDKAQSYDSSALGKAMGIGKAPKPTGKPSVKHSLKEYFSQLDDALSEAGLAVQPMPATAQQQQQKAMAAKPAFMIKDPANPNMPAITTQDPAVVQAAKNGTMSMQKPGAAPTTQPMPGATPAAGAGSQVAPMKETGDNWIKDATKNKGAFTAKAKSHGMTPAQFRAKVLAHKEDYPAKTEKQATLAKTLGKMHNEADMGEDNSESEKDFKARQERLAAAAAQTAKDPERLKRMMKIPGYAAAMGLAKDTTTKEEVDMEEGWKGAAIGGALGSLAGPAGALAGAAAGHFVGNDMAKWGKDKQVAKTAQAQKPAQSARTGPVINDYRKNKEVAEAEAPQHFAQSSPLSTANRGVLEGKKGVNPFAKKDTKKKPDADKDGVPDWADKKPGKDDNEGKKKGAAPKKGVNPFAKKDEKKKVKEGMEHHLQAARLEGKSHALRKMPYNCTHDDMEEARCYHDGFKEGLDECYGQMPILGRTAVGEMGSGPEVDTMASYGADDMGMDEGNAFTAGLAKTPHGSKFKVGGNTFTDRTRYDSNLDEFAFESLDKQLNSLLESEEKVSEGMTVSISKGQQGSPDSVSVSAQDGEADQLLSIIKSAGMGLFGGEEQGFNAPQGTAGAHGGISVVDDHDGMMSLMKKLSGGGDVMGGGDYEDEEGSGEEGHMHGEEGHSHEGGEETCNECGMMECNCEPSSGQQVVDEVESEDQMAYNVAEENAPDSGSDNTDADVAGNAAANSALATADAGEDEEEGQVYSKPVSEDGDDEADAETEVDDAENVAEGNANDTCKKCDCSPCKCETVAESFSNLYKKLALLSEESTSEKDDKAEKAAKKVAKDIEYDEGHKDKDDDKAEEAGKKVKKDIEYDDKKDKKEKKLDEWANEAGKNGTDASFEADIDFMTKVISGGLNKQKSTGQTTIPVINGQKSRMGVDGLGSPMKESTDLLKDYLKLSGL